MKVASVLMMGIGLLEMLLMTAWGATLAGFCPEGVWPRRPHLRLWRADLRRRRRLLLLLLELLLEVHMHHLPPLLLLLHDGQLHGSLLLNTNTIMRLHQSP